MRWSFAARIFLVAPPHGKGPVRNVNHEPLVGFGKRLLALLFHRLHFAFELDLAGLYIRDLFSCAIEALRHINATLLLVINLLL